MEEEPEIEEKEYSEREQGFGSLVDLINPIPENAPVLKLARFALTPPVGLSLLQTLIDDCRSKFSVPPLSSLPLS